MYELKTNYLDSSSKLFYLQFSPFKANKPLFTENYFSNKNVNALKFLFSSFVKLLNTYFLLNYLILVKRIVQAGGFSVFEWFIWCTSLI